MIRPKNTPTTKNVKADFLPKNSSPFMLGQPLYKALKRKLIEWLHDQSWKPGEMIPSESMLAKHFNVSIGTVRKAVDTLVADNILIRHQGRGTFVVSNDNDRYFFSFFRIVHESGVREYPKVELLAFAEQKADLDTAKILNINMHDKTFKFRNRLSLKGMPSIVDEITVAAANFPSLNEVMLRKRTSTVYSFFQQSFGISIVRITEKLRAVRAEAPYTELLNVSVDAPLLMLTRVAYTFRDRPIELRRSYVNTQHYEYDAEPIFI